jgi:chromosome partitioning protein
MTQIICIANQKGGVGKTTTALNLSAALALAGKMTLVVDCDPQANATTGIGIDKNALSQSLYHGLIGKTPPDELICSTEISLLKVIPSRVELIGFEVEMMAEIGREQLLKNFLKKIKTPFDYILLDCPPSLSLLTLNAMSSAHSLLIPLQCEFYALEGLGQLLQTWELVRTRVNPGLSIAGILLTMFDQRTNLSHQVAEEARKYFNGRQRIFKTVIPRNVRLGEAPSFGKPILLYDPASPGSKAYTALAKEIMILSPSGGKAGVKTNTNKG